ncbi:Wadjet anti-phage system protein JetD domain-containing protein [Frateuria hangzhouensis]|uniref:Wadjet anti-phage system protein JetD domain-containing protein n=1 Tax=Frateuria hangzhouensis TaxID=2995589 RepID=UPI002260D16C|nr:Wadjet anti-phage system protein JetD domain-containing protein [Frateuria sp. STR12]MCX7515063.1 DUF2220 family protein [Frateuria sp. STR12]
MSPARQVLERLLRRAESARLRGADGRVSLPMASADEYTGLRSLEELEAFHGEVALAEREGAILAQRESRSGDGSRLLRLSVADLPALARHLGVPLLDDRVAAAARHLETWVDRFPAVAEAIAAWRAGRKVRGCGAEAAGELAQAAEAVAAREGDAGHERILRRESVRLFGDSKRLEKLTPWLEVLVTGELAATGLAKEDVWSAIGLRREPQPMLLSGVGTVELSRAVVPPVQPVHAGVRCLHVPDGPEDASLPLVRPYLGLPVESVRTVTTPARCLLTIENLATFHDATLAAGAQEVLLLYTGGMPSPAWRKAYARILEGLAPALPVYHWGDIDEGGLRIAAVLAATAHTAGRRLRPWRMSPADIPPAAARHATTPTASSLAAMRRAAARAGWQDLADALQHRPMQLEQESIDPSFPDMSECEAGATSGPAPRRNAE